MFPQNLLAFLISVKRPTFTQSSKTEIQIIHLYLRYSHNCPSITKFYRLYIHSITNNLCLPSIFISIALVQGFIISQNDFLLSYFPSTLIVPIYSPYHHQMTFNIFFCLKILLHILVWRKFIILGIAPKALIFISTPQSYLYIISWTLYCSHTELLAAPMTRSQPHFTPPCFCSLCLECPLFPSD